MFIKLGQILLCTYTIPVLFALWCTSPIWTHDHLLFMGKPTTDNVVTPWFYDFVARNMAEGKTLSLLNEFDFPNPHHYSIEFPSAVDAMVFAPIAWIFAWPAQWAWTITAAIVFNTIAVATLARVIGLGTLGVNAAGMFAVLMRPLWADIIKGRMNVVTPGFAVLAMTGVLICFPYDALGNKRHPFVRIWGFVLAYCMGVLSALIYPPFLLLLLPVGVVLVWKFWRQGGIFSPFWGVVAGGLAYATIFETLWKIYYENYRTLDCADLTCPDKYNSLAMSNLALVEPIASSGLSLSGISGGAWVLCVGVLLARRMRGQGLLLCILAGVGAFLSLGPCPASTPDTLWKHEWLASIKILCNPIWCASMHMHDFARYAVVVCIVLAICSGITIDALWNRFGYWGKSVAMIVLGYALSLTYTPLMQEILHPSKWYYNPPNKIAKFMADKPTQTIAELPFDRSAQFLSAIQAPYVYRVNPIRPNDPPRKEERFYLWLYAVARGIENTDVPTERDIQRSGLQWIIFDPDRCQQASTGMKGCAPWVRAHLQEVLGLPEIQDGISIWHLQE